MVLITAKWIVLPLRCVNTINLKKCLTQKKELTIIRQDSEYTRNNGLGWVCKDGGRTFIQI